ncbi:MAG: Xaa-Pro peptidase family protein [Planctomycetes bacterium]|nr:Xaa-Pro peptidase family protein [Planctomycetota bacterium]
MPDAVLIYAASSHDANLLYKTRFQAGDPIIYIEAGGKSMLVLNDLELGRGKSEARVDEILSMSAIEKELKDAGHPNPMIADIIVSVFKKRGEDRVFVPATFPFELVDQLRGKGLTLTCRREPFYPERTTKTEEELGFIKESIRFTEESYACAEKALRETEIRGNELWWQGAPLTAERLRRVIDGYLYENGLLATHTIVACGEQGVDPHCRGFGPLHPHQPIIIDVFPKNLKTGYVADMTRTWVKGKASPELKKIDAAVKAGCETAFRTIKAGVESTDVHKAVVKTIEDAGFKTEVIDGKPQGFFHGTGHGIGLDVHESPGMGKRGAPLKAGMVVTVEPGLYYPGIGGVRVEDDVLVTKDGCINLCTYHKTLEIP